MNVFSGMSKRLGVVAYRAASSEEHVAAMISCFHTISIPAEYIELIREASEIELFIDGHDYFRIWGANGVLEMNLAYRIQDYLPGALAIGDDGGGSTLFYASAAYGVGLFRTGLGDLDMSDAVYIASSLTALLKGGEGLEKLTL